MTGRPLLYRDTAVRTAVFVSPPQDEPSRVFDSIRFCGPIRLSQELRRREPPRSPALRYTPSKLRRRFLPSRILSLDTIMQTISCRLHLKCVRWPDDGAPLRRGISRVRLFQLATNFAPDTRYLVGLSPIMVAENSMMATTKVP